MDIIIAVAFSKTTIALFPYWYLCPEKKRSDMRVFQMFWCVSAFKEVWSPFPSCSVEVSKFEELQALSENENIKRLAVYHKYH